LLVTSACPIHCRYCFRRNYPHDSPLLTPQAMEQALAAIAAAPDLDEVILSGGDPLMAEDGQLAILVARLNEISHLRRLRIHSRMPTVVPSRVTSELVELLHRCRLPATLVLHVNHPRELTPGLAAPLARFRQAGVTLLNQSVLLKGVNDDPDTLAALSEGLFDHGVLPYYLHLLDRVAGATHFEVAEARAVELVGEIRSRLPGYLVPRLVREIPGEASKTPV
jgi:EF-P beta-lysylation protein EpmB